MNESKGIRDRFLSVFAAVLVFSLFLFCGRNIWLRHEIVVSVGLKSFLSQTCQVFWTENADMPFKPEQSKSVRIGPTGVPVSFSLPVVRLGKLRIDFGDGTAMVRAGPVRITGKNERVLDWNDFDGWHDIARFETDSKKAVNVEPDGTDPYAVYSKPLDVSAKCRVSAFSACCLVVLSLLVWFWIAGPKGLFWNASPRRGETVCSKAFLSLATFLVVSRFALSFRLPPWFTGSPWDDFWFFRAASSLLDGCWLGSYDQHTLIKGMCGPAIFAFFSMSGIPYLVGETTLYVFSSLFFLSVVARISRNRLFLALSLALLLFNPLSMSLGAFQRIHRNGMPLWQVPLLFGSLFLLFLDAGRSWRVLLVRAVVAGLVLWMFQNTREDGVWIWPFVLVCLSASAWRARIPGNGKRANAVRSLACFVPVFVLAAGNAAVCLLNWRAYGLPVRNDRDSGYYAKAMRDLYLVEPDLAEESLLTSPEHVGHYHGIYWSTILKAFDASPTFRTARPEIEASFDRYSRGGYHDRNLYEDKPLFALRDGAAAAGFYSSLETSEAFWKSVHEELSAAFEDGCLSRRGISFTAMAAPFRPKDLPRILRGWLAAVVHAVCFRETESRLVDNAGLSTREWLPRLERLSGERLVDSGRNVRDAPFVDRANGVGRVYSAFMPWLLTAVFFVFVPLTATLLRPGKRRNLVLPGWLFAAGMLGSFLLHTACIGYMSATTFWATRGYYMTASYQLSLMFVVVVAGLCFRTFERRDACAPFGKEAK